MGPNLGRSPEMFAIEPEACVGCLACVRVCPADAIAVDESLVRIVEESCVRCGLCLPACPHAAISAHGELARAIGAAVRGDGILILSPEAVTHFFPATRSSSSTRRTLRGSAP